MWKIAGTLASMVVSGIVTLAVTMLILVELGLKFHGNYEYYGKYPVLVWGPAVIGFLAPGFVVAFMDRRGYEGAWKIVGTLALMVVSGVITYAVELQVFWELGRRLQGFDNYYARYPALVWGLHALAIIGFLAPGMIIWWLHTRTTRNGLSR